MKVSRNHQNSTWSECSNSYKIIINMVHNESPKKRHFDLVQLSGQGSRIHPAKGPNTSATSSTGSPNGCCQVQARYVSSGCSGSQKSLPYKRDPLCETVSLLDLLVPSCELCRALLADRRPRKSDFTLPTFAAKGEEKKLSFGVENKSRIQLKPRFIQRRRDVQKLQVDQMNH